MFSQDEMWHNKPTDHERAHVKVHKPRNKLKGLKMKMVWIWNRCPLKECTVGGTHLLVVEHDLALVRSDVDVVRVCRHLMYAQQQSAQIGHTEHSESDRVVCVCRLFFGMLKVVKDSQRTPQCT